MNTLENLVKICLNFKEKKYDLEEFQSRLETLLISEELITILGKVRLDATNRLEEIRFCSSESDSYNEGVEVADYILKIVNGIK